MDDGKNVYYTTLDINGSDAVTTTVTYSFDENDKLNKIVNETVYSSNENALKAYEEMKTSEKDFLPYTSLEGDRIITDTTEIVLPDWGNAGRNELIDTLKSIKY